jgi:hypothetical protein
MLALTDEALARFIRGARQIPHAERAKWLRRVACQLDPSRQTRYYRRKRDGLTTISVRADPTSLAEFLHDAGVRVLAQDRETLAMGLEELVRRWELGEVSIFYK